MNRARELLSYTALSVKEIAEATGFNASPDFSRLFKEKHGVSPVAWRDYTQGRAREQANAADGDGREAGRREAPAPGAQAAKGRFPACSAEEPDRPEGP
jgi:hypothetical protein